MNNVEYEIKVLDIDTTSVEQDILRLGGQKIGEQKFKRYIFDVNPPTKNKWIRLRTDGQKTTLTLKINKSDSIDGTEEYETTVNDLNTTRQILLQSGLKQVSYQENNRLLFELDGLEISIDSWPQIPPYLEIEGDNEELVKTMLKKLGLDKQRTTSLPTKEVYKMYDLDLDKLNPLTF